MFCRKQELLKMGKGTAANDQRNKGKSMYCSFVVGFLSVSDTSWAKEVPL